MRRWLERYLERVVVYGSGVLLGLVFAFLLRLELMP